MCPSYMATREEKHSTRGRARLLWEMLNNEEIPLLELAGRARGARPLPRVQGLHERVPGERRHADAEGRVPLAPLRAAAAPAQRLRVRADRPLGAARLGRAQGSRTSSRRRRFSAAAKAAGRRGAGAATAAVLPHDAASLGARAAACEQRPRQPVVLWPDTFTNHFASEVGAAAVEALEDAGFRVLVPQQHVCCGRPLYDYGFLDLAAQLPRADVAHPAQRDQGRRAAGRGRAELRRGLPGRADEDAAARPGRPASGASRRSTSASSSTLRTATSLRASTEACSSTVTATRRQPAASSRCAAYSSRWARRSRSRMPGAAAWPARGGTSERITRCRRRAASERCCPRSARRQRRTSWSPTASRADIRSSRATPAGARFTSPKCCNSRASTGRPARTVPVPRASRDPARGPAAGPTADGSGRLAVVSAETLSMTVVVRSRSSNGHWREPDSDRCGAATGRAHDARHRRRP